MEWHLLVKIVYSLFCMAVHAVRGWLVLQALKILLTEHQANSFRCFPLLSCTQLMLEPHLCSRLTSASIKLGHAAFLSSWITQCSTGLPPCWATTANVPPPRARRWLPAGAAEGAEQRPAGRALVGGWLALWCFARGLALMLVGRRGNWTMPIKKGRKGERKLDSAHQKGEKGLWVMEAGKFT